MKIVEGDLIDLALRGHFDVIVHGCNCMGTMGAGIAKTIKSVFPEAYEADCNTPSGDRQKLGTCSVATCQRENHTITVVNAYTQYHWKGTGVLVDYDAVRSCMAWIKQTYPQQRIGLPQIGAGLARGDWNRIEHIVKEELQGEDITLVLFRP